MYRHIRTLILLIIIPALCYSITLERINHPYLYNRGSGAGFRCITPLENGQFLIGGLFSSPRNNELDFYFWLGESSLDLDSVYYQRHYGSSGCFQYANKIVISSNGNLALFGEFQQEDHEICNYRITAMSLDEDRDSLWYNCYGELHHSCHFVDAIKRNDDDGYIIISHRQDDLYNRWNYIELYSIDTDGNLEDIVNYGDDDIHDDDEYGYDPRGIINLEDEGYLVYGKYVALDRGYVSRGFIMRINNDFNIEWSTTIIDSIRGEAAQNGYFRCATPSVNGGFLLAGGTDLGRTSNYHDKHWIVKVDDEGDVQWERVYVDYFGDRDNWFKHIFETEDGNILAFGKSESLDPRYESPCIMLADEDGDVIEEYIVEEYYSTDYFRDVAAINNDEYVAIRPAGTTIIKINLGQGSVADNLTTTCKSFKLYPAYPNPFNTQARFVYSLPYSTSYSLYLYDHAGRFVRSMSSGYGVAGVHHGWLDAGSLPSGSYYIRLLTPDGSVTSPIVITK